MGDSLLCPETEQRCVSPEPEEQYEDDDDDEDDYVHMLIQREKIPLARYVLDERIRCARLDSIDSILGIRARFGFGFQTAYLSVTYLDRFLSRRSINSGHEWAIRLLSVACLSVAAKMEECMVPPLRELSPAEGGDMCTFDSNVVQRTEISVLSTLEWNTRLVTPFAYIDYFVVKLCGDRSMRKSIISRIEQIIMASMRDVNLISHRPSVLASAATLVALDSKLTEHDLELKINALAPFPSGFLKMADVVSCYNQMQKLHNMGNVPLPECIESSDLSQVRWRVDSAPSKKRKRLVFEE